MIAASLPGSPHAPHGIPTDRDHRPPEFALHPRGAHAGAGTGHRRAAGADLRPDEHRSGDLCRQPGAEAAGTAHRRCRGVGQPQRLSPAGPAGRRRGGAGVLARGRARPAADERPRDRGACDGDAGGGGVPRDRLEATTRPDLAQAPREPAELPRLAGRAPGRRPRAIAARQDRAVRPDAVLPARTPAVPQPDRPVGHAGTHRIRG